MNRTIDQLSRQGEMGAAVFGVSSSVVDAAGTDTGISLRYPVFVDSNAKSLMAGAANAQPPFYNLPGFAYSYEIPLGDEPAYVYFAAVPTDERPVDDLTREIQTAVSRVLSGAAWQNVSLETFSGGSITLKRLSATGPQTFGGSKTDGKFELYLVPSQNYNVLIGWRASSATDSAHGFFERVAIAMGSIEGSK